MKYFHLPALAAAVDLYVFFRAPVWARIRYVDPWLYQELLWDRQLVWQIPEAARMIFVIRGAAVIAAILLFLLWRKSRSRTP